MDPSLLTRSQLSLAFTKRKKKMKMEEGNFKISVSSLIKFGKNSTRDRESNYLGNFFNLVLWILHIPL